MKAIKAAIVLALLLFSSSAHAENFDPEMLGEAVIVFATPCNRLACVLMVRDDRLYAVIFDGGLEPKSIQYVYEIVDIKGQIRPSYRLLWAKMMI